MQIFSYPMDVKKKKKKGSVRRILRALGECSMIIMHEAVVSEVIDIDKAQCYYSI